VYKSISRLALHLYSCKKAHAWKPGLLADLVVSAGASGAAAGMFGAVQAGFPPITHQQRLNFATSMLRSGMPFDAFDSPHWRKSLADISGGRFNGPGHCRRVGGALLVESVRAADAEVGAILGGAGTVSCSIDGLVDATGKVVYNVMLYVPAPYFVASFRLGAAAASAENLRAHLVAALATPLAARVSLFDSFPGAARPCREAYVASRQLLTFCSDNPTVMQSLRRLVTDTDMALFAYGCAAHAANLVGKDLARLEPFRSARIDAVTIIVFFTRSSRAMAMLLTNVHQLRVSGEKVPFLRTYSRTRWVGETASIASVIGSIAALRRTLSDNVHARPAVVIPPAVTAAGQGAGLLAGMERAMPFLRLLSKCVASIEAENAPFSTGADVFCALRLCLSTSFPDLPVDTRTAIQSSIAARYSLIHDPVLALAFWIRFGWGCECGGPPWSGVESVFFLCGTRH